MRSNAIGLLFTLAVVVAALFIAPAAAQYEPTSTTTASPTTTETTSSLPATSASSATSLSSLPPSSATSGPAPTETGAAEPVSTATVYDYLSTNGSFVVFTSLLSRYDDLWPLLSGFPPGTPVTGGVTRRIRKRMLWERLNRRQDENDTEAVTPEEADFPANYTVLAPTDASLAEIFSNVTLASIIEDPYTWPFWKLVTSYSILKGQHDLREELGSEPYLPYGTINEYCWANISTSGPNLTANSAYLYTDVPVKTGNGYIYPISSFIYPFDYESFPNGLYANIDWVLGVTIRVNGLGGSE